MKLAGAVAAALFALGAALPHADAAEKLQAGTLGGQAPLWPFYIAMNKGFLAAEGIDMDVTFASSGSAVLQALTGGSISVAISVGLAEPMQAIDKGAPLAIVRIIGKTAPYVLIAKPSVRSIVDLKGKTISIGSPSDITNVYFARMMEAVGLKPGDYETISAGVASARLAALEAGVADAAMVLPPLNFHAAKAGFHTIALAHDYVKDVPFTAMVVLRPWAVAHPQTLRHLMDATDKSVLWFKDNANRDAAIDVLVTVGKATRADAEASYDFLRHIDYFEADDKVSRAGLETLIKAETARKLLDPGLTVDRLVLPGVTDVTQ
jgi:ABC-type nitrate/sulfonate/bicarbonate transport system substrate-binding protein